MARAERGDRSPAAAAGNDALHRAETVGDPPGFIAEETPGTDATAAAWRAHLAWLRTLPPGAEERDQRIRDAEAKIGELEGRPAPPSIPQPHR